MKTEYNTLFMRKVYTNTGIVLFETEEQAEEYANFLKTQGENANVNVWSWEVKIEK